MSVKNSKSRTYSEVCWIYTTNVLSFSLDCEKPCPKIWGPICGSDGETYGNECLFEIAQCKNPSLTITHKGTICCTIGNNDDESGRYMW